ncbi:hypothetical protein HYV43_00385 [Candidatus Micrarchaeota archaeon]|nr:hypothetical protein [Candidatus Micrarchaeota archaeon]
MAAVVDSSCLIFAAKTPPMLDWLVDHFGRLYVPKAVYAEVVEEGKKRGFAEIGIVERKFAAGVLVRARAAALAQDVLGPGEAEALALAKQKHLVCLCDDRKAHSVGSALGIRVVSLAAFLIFLARKKNLPVLALEKCLNELVENGYYLKTADYLAVLRAIRIA